MLLLEIVESFIVLQKPSQQTKCHLVTPDSRPDREMERLCK